MSGDCNHLRNSFACDVALLAALKAGNSSGIGFLRLVRRAPMTIPTSSSRKSDSRPALISIRVRGEGRCQESLHEGSVRTSDWRVKDRESSRAKAVSSSTPSMFPEYPLARNLSLIYLSFLPLSISLALGISIFLSTCRASRLGNRSSTLKSIGGNFPWRECQQFRLV